MVKVYVFWKEIPQGIEKRILDLDFTPGTVVEANHKKITLKHVHEMNL